MSMMRLDRLTELRDTISSKPFPIPDEELIRRYEALFGGPVSDVMREFTMLDQTLPHDIVPLRNEVRVCGIAFTIKSSTNPTIHGEMDKRAQMLDAMVPGAFIVWDTGGDNESAHWGEIMTAVSKAKGARAAAVDGGLRDTYQVLEQGFPVYYKYRTAQGSLGRCQLVAYQVPIVVGKVLIKPGDVVYADIDGVVIVPRDIAYDVLVRAEEIIHQEKDIKKWIQSGQTAVEVTRKGGYF